MFIKILTDHCIHFSLGSRGIFKVRKSNYIALWCFSPPVSKKFFCNKWFSAFLKFQLFGGNLMTRLKSVKNVRQNANSPSNTLSTRDHWNGRRRSRKFTQKGKFIKNFSNKNKSIENQKRVVERRRHSDTTC